MPVTGVLTSDELKATIDTPAFGAAEQKVWDSPLIDERPATILAPISQAVADYIPKVTESLQGAIGPVAQVPGLLVEGAYEPVNKVLTGQPMSFGETATAAAELFPAAGALAKGTLTAAQKGLGITRRLRIMDPQGTQGFYGPGSEFAVKRMEAMGFTPNQIRDRLDWYRGGQPAQLGLMGTEMMDTFARTFFSPGNDKLLQKYGIAPHIADDYRRMFELEDAMDLNGTKWQNRDMLYNEMLSQLKYNLDVMIRRDPDAVPEIADLFYTNRMAVKASDLSDSGLPIKKLFGGQLDMSADAIRDHIGVHAAKAGTFGERTIQLSGTRFSHLPTSMMSGPGSMKDNPGRMAYDVIRRMPDDMPRTLENIFDTARKETFSDKRVVDVSKLRENAVDSGGFISFGGRSLGADRQFGNYDWRLVINKKNGEGYMVMMDEMKLGMDKKIVNDILQYGGDESLGIDIIPLDKNLEAKMGPSLTGAVGHKEASPMIREYVEKAKADKPTIADQFQFVLKRAAQSAGAYEAYKLGNHMVSQIPFESVPLEEDYAP